MKCKTPSVEALMKHFNISKSEAQEIKDGFKRYYGVGVGLYNAKRIIGGHGINNLYPEYPDVMYIVMGDTYDTTLLWTGKSIIISSLGDWVEHHKAVPNDGMNPR